MQFAHLVLLSAAATVDVNSSVVLGSAGNVCAADQEKLTTLATCRAGMRLAGQSGDSYNGAETSSDWPSGCYYCDDVDDCADGTWLNEDSTGEANGGARPYCSSGFLPLSQGETLFVGDSDIDYWENSLSVITPSYNVGYGGYTCENVLAEASTMSSAFAPSTVVLVCGENDFGSDSRSTADTFALFTQIVDAYLAGGARVVYIGTKPEPGTTELHAQYKEYDALIAQLAADRAAGGGLPPLTMIDSNAGFVAAGNGADLYSGDELHLSPAGYSLWESWLTAAVTPTADDVNCYLWQSGSCVAGGADRAPTTSPTDPADSAATMKPAMLGLVLSLVVALL